MSNTIYSDKIKVNCLLVHDENGYYHLVYKVTNVVNGKIYIGKHSTKEPYDNYMGSGNAIKQAIKKYGVENFTKEILYCFTEEKEAFLKEEELVTQEFIDREDTYNMTFGGNGMKSGEKNPNFGIPRSQKIKDKISKANKGNHHTQEVKDKMSKKAKERTGEKSTNAKAVLKFDEFSNIITKYVTMKECCEREEITRRVLSRLITKHIFYNRFYFVFESKN